ncbi:MAG: AAA family ATPase [Flavobacteriales bacterium]
MIRIAITGPECSGKTALSTWLSERIFDARMMPEHSRHYLERNNLGKNYNNIDITNIGRELSVKMSKAFRSDNDVLICDTDFYVLDIWWREKVGGSNLEFEEFKQTFDFDLFILCKPDLKWEEDPLRENPHDRDRLFDLYKEALERDDRSFYIVSGLGDTRMQQVLEKILRRFPNLMLKEEG